jgi:hypothetical protein
MKIRPVGARVVLRRQTRHTDKQDEANRLFRNFANEPKKFSKYVFEMCSLSSHTHTHTHTHTHQEVTKGTLFVKRRCVSPAQSLKGHKPARLCKHARSVIILHLCFHCSQLQKNWNKQFVPHTQVLLLRRRTGGRERRYNRQPPLGSEPPKWDDLQGALTSKLIRGTFLCCHPNREQGIP